MAIKKLAVGAVVVALLAAGAGGWWLWTAHLSPVAKAQERVRAHLRDPDSARFDSVTISAKTGAVCGRLNARNAMGGYTGFRSFVLFPDDDLRVAPEEADSSAPTALRIEALQQRLNFLTLAEANCV